MSLGAFDSSGTLEVLYDFGSASTGFQFDVTGLVLTGGSGGAAGDAGFTVSTGGETVLGFSFTGSSIPAGSGVLTVLSFSDVSGATTDLSLGFSGAITDANGVPFSNQSAGGSIAHGDPDCSGDYYGDLVVDDCGVCGGGNADDLGCGCFEDGPSGCDNECGSTAVEDDCGVCDGDGSSCLASLGLGAFDASGSLDVTYDFGGPVAGFQFDVTGLVLTGASGGAAGDAGLTVSVGGATVLGFSFDNSEIPAGSGTLTTLAFSSVTAGSTDLSLGNFGAVTDASGNVYNTSASGSVDHGDPDCAGTYYGDAVVDECGECGGDGIDEGACDCDGNTLDCAGDCGGDAVVDNCDVCDSDSTNDCDADCAGNWAVSYTHLTLPTNREV